MTRYRPLKKSIFQPGTAADVVDDQVSFASRVTAVGDKPDMRCAAFVEVPGNDIAGLKSGRRCRYRQRLSLSAKIGLQVWDASVVDIGVGTGEPPFLRILAKVSPHVLVNLFLQVDARPPKCADNNVGASSGLGRYVAIRVGDAEVVLRVSGRDLKLLLGTGEQLADLWVCDLGGRGLRSFARGNTRHSRVADLGTGRKHARRCEKQAKKGHFHDSIGHRGNFNLPVKFPMSF